MRIRVKNKHLILALVVILLSAGLVYAAGGEYLYQRAEKAKNDNDYTTALAYYDALITRYPGHIKVPEALRWTIETLQKENSRIKASFTHNSSGMTVLPAGYEPVLLQSEALTMEERCWMLYNYYKENEMWEELRWAFEALGEAIEGRSFADAEEFYWDLIINREWRIMLEAVERLVQLYIHYGMFDQAFAAVDYSMSFAAGIRYPETWLGDIYFAMGDLEQAGAMYQKGFTNTLERRNRFEFIKQNKGKETHVVEGIVTLDGAPFPDVRVVVYPGPEVVVQGQSRRITQSYLELFSVKTRHDGSFTLGLPEGNYNIGIELNLEQILKVEEAQLQIKNSTPTLASGSLEPGLIEFNFTKPLALIQPGLDFEYTGGPIYLEWEKEPKADHYTVSVRYHLLGESSGTETAVTKTLVTTDQTGVWLDTLLDPLYLMDYDGKGIKPRALLGMPDKVSVTIEAWTADGQFIRSSDLLNMFKRIKEPSEIKLRQRALRPEEELIMERKYDEAFELLQQRLAEAPDDLDALWLLARFYYYGTRPLDYLNPYSLAHRDLGKCLETLRKIESIEPSAMVANAIQTVQEQLEGAAK